MGLSFKIVKCVDNEKCSFLFLSLYSLVRSHRRNFGVIIFSFSPISPRARLIGSSALPSIPFSLTIYFINYLIQDSIRIKYSNDPKQSNDSLHSFFHNVYSIQRLLTWLRSVSFSCFNFISQYTNRWSNSTQKVTDRKNPSRFQNVSDGRTKSACAINYQVHIWDN
jgi:hypothetical protein